MKIRCACSRQQAIARGPADLGVTLERAKEIGWTEIDGDAGKAVCPHCNGNINLLRQAFAPVEPRWRQQAMRIIERRRALAEEAAQIMQEDRERE